jgi:hypothetical protein
MIEERTQYRVKCDGCDVSPTPLIYNAWFSISPAHAERIAKQNGWSTGGARHLCPECKKEAGKS